MGIPAQLRNHTHSRAVSGTTILSKYAACLVARQLHVKRWKGVEVQMVKSLIGCLLMASVVVLGAGAGSDVKDQGWKPTPLMRSVSPDIAKSGDVLTVTGEYLDKARVKEIYLTDGKVEFKTPIVEQAETTVKVKVPPDAKPGRLRLMVLTTGVEPQFLEQPVAVTIE